MGLLASLVKNTLQLLLLLLFRVEVKGMDNYARAGQRVMIVANHTSFLDAVLLAAFLPDRLTFAINTWIAQLWWVKPFGKMVRLFPMDPVNPLSIKALIKDIEQDRRIVIFPEGRITVTGSLMKIYDGPGFIAVRSDATVLPVRIEGAQYSLFSRLKGQVHRRFFPKIILTIQPPEKINVDGIEGGRARRLAAGTQLKNIMTKMMYQTVNRDYTLMDKLLEARKVHGSESKVLEDVERHAQNYRSLLIKSAALGEWMSRYTERGARVGLLLPNTAAYVYCFFGLLGQARKPAMLNYTIGLQGLESALETAQIATVFTSRRFIKLARLGSVLTALEKKTQVIFLEDAAKEILASDKIRAMLKGLFPGLLYKSGWQGVRPEDDAVILFTSGSEGTPKGVVLSHRNLISNMVQLGCKIDFNKNDIILNALPLFHSFGLTTATLVPLLNGMKVFLYPSPLHYRIIPEIAYDINATMLFGTNTFLKGYARFAHPYDFYSVRYICAGAEAVQAETRTLYANKFGLRILEGYGATETSPVLSMNTPIDFKQGTVGQFLPGIDYFLEPVPGVAEGGRLHVRGDNVMAGYLRHENPGAIEPPYSSKGEGWYDTGDIVSVDGDGFIHILGRAKRFAKIGGEMVSLTLVEQVAAGCWPDVMHAVIALPDPDKGEKLALITEKKDAQRAELLQYAKDRNIGEINIPKLLLVTDKMPVTGTGKMDYQRVTDWVREQII